MMKKNHEMKEMSPAVELREDLLDAVSGGVFPEYSDMFSVLITPDNEASKEAAHYYPKPPEASCVPGDGDEKMRVIIS